MARNVFLLTKFITNNVDLPRCCFFVVQIDNEIVWWLMKQKYYLFFLRFRIWIYLFTLLSFQMPYCDVNIPGQTDVRNLIYEFNFQQKTFNKHPTFRVDLISFHFFFFVLCVSVISVSIIITASTHTIFSKISCWGVNNVRSKVTNGTDFFFVRLKNRKYFVLFSTP